MALNSSVLTQAIKAGLLSLPVVGDSESRTYNDVMTDDQKEAMDANIEKYAKEIVDHIVNNAAVTVAMTTHVHTGVLTGGGISGPPVPGVVEVGSTFSTPPGGVT